MENAELLQDFVVESTEHLEGTEAELLLLECEGENLETNLVNRVSRALHSIKGASGSLGLERSCELYHSMKDMLQDLGRPNSFDIGPFVAALDSIDLSRLAVTAAAPVEGAPQGRVNGSGAVVTPTATVRGVVSVLDQLMTLAGELVLSRNPSPLRARAKSPATRSPDLCMSHSQTAVLNRLCIEPSANYEESRNE
jgi:chemotaxis protein histidine kinase CheA